MADFEHYSLFGESWWLDIVAGEGNWEEIRIEKGGQIQARLPYIIKKNKGITKISSPPLAKYLGPWFAPSNAKYATELARQKDLTEQLINKLPKYDIFLQNFHPKVTNWLPLYWKGFDQTAMYTYVLNEINDPDKLWDDLKTNIRGDIRKSKDRFKLEIKNDLGVDTLIKLCNMTYKRNQIKNINEELVRKIYMACEERGNGKAFFAVDEYNQVHSAAYIVWDKRSAHYILGGGNPELRNSGAHSLMMWEAIKYCSNVSQFFDFEGSMVEAIERFFRAFGGRQVSYHQAIHMKSRFLKSFTLIKQGFKTLLKN